MPRTYTLRGVGNDNPFVDDEVQSVEIEHSANEELRRQITIEPSDAGSPLGDFRTTMQQPGGSSTHGENIKRAVRRATEKHAWELNTGRPWPDEFDFGEPMINVDEPTLRSWIVWEARNNHALDELEAAYDDGFRGITEYFLNGVCESITRRISSGENPIPAFNAVTEGWPVDARVLLAQQEAEQDRPDFPDYENEIESLAESKTIMNDSWQTTLDDAFPENPLGDNTLTTEEKHTLLYLRGADETLTQDQLDSITDHGSFRDAYNQVENVGVALNYHRLDQNAPKNVLAEAAPPDEWPDNITPESIRRQTCANCGNAHYETYVESGSIEWVTGSGERNEDTIEVSENDAWEIRSNVPPDGTLLCGNCLDDVRNRSPVLTHVPEVGNPIRARLDRMFVENLHPDELEWGDISNLSNREQEDLMDMHHPAGRNRVEGFFVSPNDELGDVSPQEEALHDLARDPTGLSSGPVTFIEDSSSTIGAFIYGGQAGAAIEVKEYLEEAVNNN